MGRKLVQGVNDLASQRPDIAAEAEGWDPSLVFVSSTKRLPWRCPKPHCNQVWVTSVERRTLKKANCLVCAGRQIVAGVNDLASRHPDIAAEANGWDPREFAHNAKIRRSWRCGDCAHVWETGIHNRTQLRTGCPACAGQVARQGVNSLLVLYPDVAKEAHGWNPDTVLPKSNVRRVWKCVTCSHEWSAPPANRVTGHGCPACSGRVATPGVHSVAALYPDIAKEAHGWDPDTVPPGSKSVRTWQCQDCGYIWETRVSLRTVLWRGCPACATCGFDPSIPGVVYLLRKTDEISGREMRKIGISNHPKRRNTVQSYAGWEVLDMTIFMAGSLARQAEQMFLRWLDARGVLRGVAAFDTPFDGYTESWFADSFEAFSLSDIAERVAESIRDCGDTEMEPMIAALRLGGEDVVRADTEADNRNERDTA